ncbi:MAG: hypothetical protein Unbinned2903contig1001_28 [Prokaryotic dsDNA virus sp.]|nr:MAG: hypothetical protein Unbinned2903contig1001_28 [Prokaryotic dsDNA virus sp.]|tara:strand:+ start:3405 stop:3629 length:225 start_codon:yes stop_codon:yes gene_type:complete
MDNNFKDLVGSIQKNIDLILKKNNELMSKLPIEDQSKVTHISKDINTAIQAARDGDVEKITKLSSKYASYNNIK